MIWDRALGRILLKLIMNNQKMIASSNTLISI